MSSEGSVTCWFLELERGNVDAAEALWKRYYPELVRLARKKLGGTPRRVADEEDVALSAMDSFFDAAQHGRFPNLADRHGLWRLLLQITARKVIDLKRHETRKRRGGGHVHGDSALQGDDSKSDALAVAPIIGDAPTPELAAMMAEEYRLLLGQLADPDLQALAIAKMQGYTNQEIAERVGCSPRTIERRLMIIRKKWNHKQPP